ncbi:MAG: protein phosphatase 2C domain-containing protein [Verrucomicrobiota bacterium]
MSESANNARLAWSGMTHPGRVRRNNEDAFLALAVDAEEMQLLGKVGEDELGRQDFIFAVSDGMGGANAGEFASRIAVDKIAAMLPRSYWLGAIGIRKGTDDYLISLFAETHAEMQQMGISYPECQGMGATLSLCWFSPGRMHFAHVGDSRIYYLPKDGQIKQLTEDHTHVGWLVRTGQITESEARYHPDKSGLQQVLGGNVREPVPQIGVVKYEVGDRFILTSDGVTDGLSSNGIASKVIGPLGQKSEMSAAERIIQEALFNSGRDNLTALVVEVS